MMSSVSGGGSVSGCDVWAKSGAEDFPSGNWSTEEALDPPKDGKAALPSPENVSIANLNVEETMTSLKEEVKSLLNCLDTKDKVDKDKVDKDKEDSSSSAKISAISDKVDSLRKFLLAQDDLETEKGPEKLAIMCDSTLISGLLGCGAAKSVGLGGKGAQLLYHLLKREDQLGGGKTESFLSLKDGKMMKELVKMVDNGGGGGNKDKDEVAKFWGLSALEFILRGGDPGLRKVFLEELDGVAILMRIKDGFSHSVDLQNATDRILITLEELEEEQQKIKQESATTTTTTKASTSIPPKQDTEKSANDFPTVGIWQPPAPPVAKTTSTTTPTTNNQSTLPSSTSTPVTPATTTKP